MKSRVINTKHLMKVPEGFLGLTSKLKPSLFYGNPAIEGVVWLQSEVTNKMACWELKDDKMVDGVRVWTYAPTQKFINKFPHIEDKTFVVKFDMVQDSRFARKKRMMTAPAKKKK